MRRPEQSRDTGPTLTFYGGTAGALFPFVVFLGGVGWLGLSGASDETGFWPVLLGALMAGLLLARQRSEYSEVLLRGMSQPIVMLMVMAWILAGVLGVLLAESGLVQALVAVARASGVSGGGYVAVAFVVCAFVSTATGTSLGTILVCAPLLYPIGGGIQAEPAVLMGAIIGGATFGDNVSPVSDTTIASAASQGADIGGVVRSRLKYAFPAAAIALMGFLAVGGVGVGGGGGGGADAALPVLVEGIASGGDVGRGLAMLLVPVLVLGLLLSKRHLLEGLMFGILAAVLLGLMLGVFVPSDILSVGQEDFRAGGLILSGMQRGVGVSIFTILLMGLVAGLEAAGVLERLIQFVQRHATTARHAEWWIFGAVSGAVLLTTHSVVAILTVGRMTAETGEAHGIPAYRRANLLDMTVCTYPFMLPFFIPTVLAASATASGADFGMPRVSPAAVGLHNFHSWALLAITLGVIVTGWGRLGGRTGQQNNNSKAESV